MVSQIDIVAILVGQIEINRIDISSVQTAWDAGIIHRLPRLDIVAGAVSGRQSPRRSRISRFHPKGITGKQ